MSFLEGGFSKNEKARREIRDRYRAKFFSELGVEPCHDIMRDDLDSKEFVEAMPALLKKAQSIHEDETSAIKSTQETLQQIGLGQGSLPKPPASRPNLKALSPSYLAKHYFYSF